jgi:hypothetical protein
VSNLRGQFEGKIVAPNSKRAGNPRWRNKMFTGLFFVIAIAIVLYGLVNSTEKVLDIRHQQREEGKKPNVYL